ncbi:hypothetical protein BC943DRAFT_170590 [Umbelopsis sp. AD052]|nr:hypothetical protein BC943DRAFT_170590 [Umbelopsis sp. AD052]
MVQSLHGDIVKVPILGNESIILGFHLISFIAADLVQNVKASTYIVITDSNIASIHLSPLVSAMKTAMETQGSTSRIMSRVIKPGELSKSRVTKAALEDWLLSEVCTRDTCLIALGGGVIGDLVGFVAATFMRGIPFVQVPTTLLAMVDSSIGGKTAIDTAHGKNLIGAFWQPKRIYMNLSFLSSLPKREFVNGMAEVIKTACIWSLDDFIKLEEGVVKIQDAVLKGVEDNVTGSTVETRTEGQCLLLDVIVSSARVKAHVVTVDERESGLRGLLNYGHSIGHAIEAILAPEVLHGECVAIGMIQEAELSYSLGHLGSASIERISRCLSSYGLPISLEDERLLCRSNGKPCPVNNLMDNMRIDKKNSGSTKKIVLLSAIGKTLEQKASAVNDEAIEAVLKAHQPKISSLKRAKIDSPSVQEVHNKSFRSFVSLSFQDYNMVPTETLQAIAKDTSAVEFRVDLLRDPDNAVPSAEFVQEQLTILRNKIGTTPIVFTVRTQSQAGTFPDECQDKMFELLQLGIQSGCEFVDVDMTASVKDIEALVSAKGSSTIIASFHDPVGQYSWSSDMMQFYEKASLYGDVVKLIGTAKCMQDNIELEVFREQVKGNFKPLIAVNMGDKGKLSRLLNPFLTPTTHILLPFVAAPGQMTDQQIEQWRKELCL